MLSNIKLYAWSVNRKKNKQFRWRRCREAFWFDEKDYFIHIQSAIIVSRRREEVVVKNMKSTVLSKSERKS